MKNIKIIGCGTEGANTVGYIKSKGISGGVCIAMDSAEESLSSIDVDLKVVYKKRVSFEKAAKLSENDIVFIIAGLGGACGRELAETAAKQIHGIACCYCIMPFEFEGEPRNKKAFMEYDRLTELGINTVKINSNDFLRKTINNHDEGTTVGQMFDTIFDYIYHDILIRAED